VPLVEIVEHAAGLRVQPDMPDPLVIVDFLFDGDRHAGA
jgi:hypothetical protein